MAGLKTNERPGTRAQAKYVRSSAYKAREVLNQIRNKSYLEAAEILEFSERGISKEVAKVLQSAAANAFHNDDLDPEELFVSACFADEGVTLKRVRPRARGRATPILKRTCHITVILSEYDPEELAAIREREAAGGRGVASETAQARLRRVQRSRERARQAETESSETAEAAAPAEPTVEEQAAEIVAATEQALASAATADSPADDTGQAAAGSEADASGDGGATQDNSDNGGSEKPGGHH